MSFVSIKTAIMATAAVAGSLAFAPAAEAKNTAGNTFRIRASVPVACWVRPDRNVEAAEGFTGSVVEACNSRGGYVVNANYRPLQAGETASMVYGERTFNLSASGGQELRRSNMATIRNVSYRFQNVSVDTPLTLTLTIQPL